MRRIALALALAFCPLVAVAPEAFAQEEGGNQEADRTQAPTIEIQQEQEVVGGGFSAHGIAYVSYNAPIYQAGGFNLFLSQAEFKWDGSNWGLYATPRVKVSDFSSPIDRGYLYLQQAYGYLHHNYGDIKVGKVYGRFGRFWDFGFYGPLMANNDVKLTPDLGISAEGAPSLAGPLEMEYAAQYFVTDGRTLAWNNRDAVSLTAARRRNIATLRLAPTWRIDPHAFASIGFSGQRYDSAVTNNHRVVRGAVDINGQYGPISAFVEVGRQNSGDIVVTARLPITSNNYLWTGAELKMGDVSMRYHFNAVAYDDTERSIEILHQPGIEYAINETVGVMGELAWWTTNNDATGRGEKSFYAIADAKF